MEMLDYIDKISRCTFSSVEAKPYTAPTISPVLLTLSGGSAWNDRWTMALPSNSRSTGFSEDIFAASIIGICPDYTTSFGRRVSFSNESGQASHV